MNAKNTYKKRIFKYEKLCDTLKKRLHATGNWRLLTAISGIIIAAIADWMALYYLLWSVLVIFTSIFIYLVVVYRKIKKLLVYGEQILNINRNAFKRLEGTWLDFTDTGEAFKNENHAFSHDLDLFGRGSLFQWINTARTYLGRKKLKTFLTSPCYDHNTLKDRQEALNELGKMRWWRQKYEAEAIQIVEQTSNDNDLLKWLKNNNHNDLYTRSDIIYVFKLLPGLTIISFLLSYGFNHIPRLIPVLLIFIQISLLLIGVKKRNEALKTVYTSQRSIRTYGKMLKHFEKTSFNSKYIKNLKDKIMDNQGLTAYDQLKALEKIADKISNRSNFVFIPINIIFLWDYQCMIALEKWKLSSGHLVEEWLSTLGELEALSSLAIISYDYPNWAVPEFTLEKSVFIAQDIGHPLLTNKQVYNDLTIKEPQTILLITGSNMSGKSTLLRTAGINLVLAYAGAPVCAKKFKCSFMRIFTCMRVSDNLEKSISSFYAELLRIKEIIQATKHDQQVFFLLDEIFKGTNSHDRHIGAKKLITKLYKENAMGFVSTHDLELGELEEETNGSVVNYNFQEHYKNNKIYFDYKLRKGISTTRNALYLMKMIGIED
ncbi:DNA mismatch repair protein [Serpentinicella sp. ANB-PHB4]|uniref:MutS-related protein n=1 Tax=Serpentinicella sp. ANB-PHB4 TaxID=3074076 RepID=UPI00285B1980|nr:DNA mismatch repair protein [Serpentinicella sp. ANB-PHB4]MDR5658378.1 DNA mismatch repair protein [Serpentinicella sp. ANB-PHB4]